LIKEEEKVEEPPKVIEVLNTTGKKSLRIVCISDTHGKHRKVEVPPGDVLVHAGDITSKGQESQIRDFCEWLGSLPHEHKIVICGNHDLCFEDTP
jgi:predicted phosphodiesterase